MKYLKYKGKEYNDKFGYMKILLGVTGSISAYKACDIVSGLIANGYEVKVIMTDSAKMFIPEMPLAVLSRNKVASNFDDEIDGEVTHITLAEWGDIFIIAPASATTIAKLACGIADNVLTATALAWNIDKPQILYPAMNPGMYSNLVTQENINHIKKNGWDVCKPDFGTVACGAEGIGKLPNPRLIVKKICSVVGRKFT